LATNARASASAADALAGFVVLPAIADSSTPVYSGYMSICPAVSAL
jgi:hypothetical protein